MREAGPPLASADDGFSIVEVLVAMLMLALLALSFLPVLITGLRLTTSNSSATTAAQLVREQLSLARAQTATCAALQAFKSTTASSVNDGAGKTLIITKDLTCTAPASGSSGTATFTATVTATGSSAVLASATTLIYVSSS